MPPSSPTLVPCGDLAGKVGRSKALGTVPGVGEAPAQSVAIIVPFAAAIVESLPTNLATSSGSDPAHPADHRQAS
jgi:hypothetical protein